jgi:hypothetical protein
LCQFIARDKAAPLPELLNEIKKAFRAGHDDLHETSDKAS